MNNSIAKKADLNPAQIDIMAKLDKFDKEMLELDPEHESMAEAWGTACSYKDTNEIILNNIRKLEAMIDNEHSERLRIRKMHGRFIKTPQEEYYDDPTNKEKREKLIDVLREFKGEEGKATKQLIALTRALRDLVQEYRTCLTSKRFYVHINQVKQLSLLFKSTLFDEIHDANTLQRVSRKLDDGYRKIFFVQVTEDGKGGE
jgi:hypothetical protein